MRAASSRSSLSVAEHVASSARARLRVTNTSRNLAARVESDEAPSLSAEAELLETSRSPERTRAPGILPASAAAGGSAGTHDPAATRDGRRPATGEVLPPGADRGAEAAGAADAAEVETGALEELAAGGSGGGLERQRAETAWKTPSRRKRSA